jgi:hypothetical protein
MRKTKSNQSQPVLNLFEKVSNKRKSSNLNLSTSLQTTTDQIQNEIQKEFHSMNTNINKSVFELSTDHRVVCLFIKWFGCPMCQEVIEEVGKNLKTMVQMNTIPIIIHQERDEDAVKYFGKSKDLNVCRLPFAKTSTKLQELLGITSASFYNHAEAMIKTDVLSLMVGPKKRNFTVPLNVSNPLSKFGIVFIEKGIVKREVIFSKLHKRIDFGLFLNDISSTSSFNPQILNYFKDFEGKEKVNFVNSTLEKEDSKKLSKVIQSDLGRYYFKAFATSEYSIENISFYEQVSMYKNMRNSKKFELSSQVEKIQELIETFLQPSSIMQLNTTNENISNLLKNYQEMKEGNIEKIDNLFDEILVDIMCVLEDTYSRFKFSRYNVEYEKAMISSNQTINYLI